MFCGSCWKSLVWLRCCTDPMYSFCFFAPPPPHHQPSTHTCIKGYTSSHRANPCTPAWIACLRWEEKHLRTCCSGSPEARRFLHTSQICSPFDVGVLTHVLPPPNRFTWILRLQLHPHPFLTGGGSVRGGSGQGSVRSAVSRRARKGARREAAPAN